MKPDEIAVSVIFWLALFGFIYLAAHIAIKSQ